MAEQESLTGWFGETFPLPQKPRKPKKGENPCVLLYGSGPEDKKCGDCTHFHRLYYHNQTYFKCDLRKITHGAASDHRLRWPTCSKFEERTTELEEEFG